MHLICFYFYFLFYAMFNSQKVLKKKFVKENNFIIFGFNMKNMRENQIK